MTRNQIYDLLIEVFSEFQVKLIDKSTWSKIYVGKDLEVYTYSGYPDREDSVWYFNIYYNGNGKEIKIPNKNSKEFLCRKIDENQLIKAFDNDVESLTRFWKFGSLGQTDEIPTELLEKYDWSEEHSRIIKSIINDENEHIEDLKKLRKKVEKEMEEKT